MMLQAHYSNRDFLLTDDGLEAVFAVFDDLHDAASEGQLDATTGDSQSKPQSRPRTVNEAKARKGIPLTGEKLRQEGGVANRGNRISLDVKASPFGDYDRAFIAAVEQCWYDLLDQHNGMRNIGKVTVDFQMTPDGRITDLKVTETGVLETGDGFPLMGSGGPITVPPAQKILIAEDGTLSIMPMGAPAGSTPQVIDRIRMANPEGSQTVKGLDNLLRVKGGGVLPDDLDAKVITGSLEGSNVNLTQALVDMIENQRSYEVQANLLKEAKSMDEASASLMRLPG